jgi:protein-S-isoprenylcysteine O-methyltransferase Ste14
LTRTGGRLFYHRTWLPFPIIAALLLVPAEARSPLLLATGVALVAAAELLRIWSVRHIGTVSRTRSDRLGPLVSSGPFAFIRNPLYVANIALWTGFALSARILWLAPIIILALALEYHAIVLWEERLLESRIGDAYRAYAARVPRWIPSRPRPAGGTTPPRIGPARPVEFSWRETLFSERGTLLAIVAGYVLLWIKGTVTFQ